MTGPVLRLAAVERRYTMGSEEVRAVRGVSLEIDSGDYVAIVGPSGCGKSTLLNLLGAIDRPDRGHVYLDARFCSPWQKLRIDAGILRIKNHHWIQLMQGIAVRNSLGALRNTGEIIRCVIRERKQLQSGFGLDYLLKPNNGIMKSISCRQSAFADAYPAVETSRAV